MEETALVPASCPCPDTRKLLAETAQGIVKLLLQKIAAEKPAPLDPSCLPESEAQENLEPCTHCGGTRPCGIHCNCPCHGYLAKRTCSETFARDQALRRVPFSKIEEPPDPETVQDCKSEELRAGKFLSTCVCIKRNGLQHECKRYGCSEKCPRLRPAARGLIQLGDSVPAMDSTPRCCAGKLQLELERQMEEKLKAFQCKRAQERKVEDEPPPPLPPPPPFNWVGVYPHVCRKNTKPVCRPRPMPKTSSAGADCKTGTRPCTYPICRADCFEPPPPAFKTARLEALQNALIVTSLDNDKADMCAEYP